MLKCLILLTFLFVVNSLDSSLCSNRGNMLKNSTKCLCIEGYTTYPVENNRQCNYEMKSENIAVFLAFFAGVFGADMFYLGYNFKGFIKLILPLVLMTLSLKYKNKLNNEKLELFFIFLPFSLLVVMWIYDIFVISSGTFVDIYGILLTN